MIRIFRDPVYVLVWIQGMGGDICFCYKKTTLVLIQFIYCYINKTNKLFYCYNRTQKSVLTSEQQKEEHQISIPNVCCQDIKLPQRDWFANDILV